MERTTPSLLDTDITTALQALDHFSPLEHSVHNNDRLPKRGPSYSKIELNNFAFTLLTHLSIKNIYDRACTGSTQILALEHTIFNKHMCRLPLKSSLPVLDCYYAQLC